MIPLNLREDEFERALAEFQQFGPRRGIPIEDRWCEILPGLPSTQLQMLLAVCKEIESYAYHVAQEVVYGNLADQVASKQLADRFPFLTDVQVRRALSRACYFAAK